MNLTTTSFKRVAPALLAAAVVAPAGHATNGGAPPAGFYNAHLVELTAMAHGAWRLPIVGPVVRTPAPASHYNAHLVELTAMAHGAWRLPIVGPVVRTAAPTVSEGFNWADAGIGAMSGFAAAVAVGGTLVLLLRRRADGAKTSTPTTA